MHYAGHWPRYKPVDFRKGTEHGLEGTIDWPISYEDLAPFYDRERRDLRHLRAASATRRYPDRKNAERDPMVLPGQARAEVRQGVARPRLALVAVRQRRHHRGPARTARPTQACGNELSGSPTGSLSHPGATRTGPTRSATGADLRTMARVETITAEGGRATGAIYIDRTTGERHEIRAKIVVLAANGIGSPRLLLQSAQKGHPTAWRTANGIVGKYLMHHVFAFCDSWFDEPVEGFKGSFGAPLYSHEFYHTDMSTGDSSTVSGCRSARSFGPSYAAMGTHTGYTAPWGEKHREFFDDHFANHLMVFMFGEDLPVETNRVTLDPDVTDSDGHPGRARELRAARERRRARGVRHRAHLRGHPGGRRGRDQRHRRALPAAGLAPHGHLPDGQHARRLGAQQVEPDLGPAEPVRRRRQLR